MSALIIPSRFRVVSDTEYLYVAFEADLESMDAIDNLSAVGKGGVAWRWENLELVVYAFGVRECYVHFMLNPVPIPASTGISATLVLLR